MLEKKKGAILILSGPSGAGKSTIINMAAGEIGEYYFSISTTTRTPREGEVCGQEYFFVSRKVFEEDIEAGNFLEYAEVHGNYYGTSLKPVREALNAGKLVIFDIDVQGHRLIRAKMNDITTSVFITPPTLAELKSRLYDRCTDNEEIIACRIENAKKEILAIEEYDFTIINNTIEEATRAFVIAAKAARLKQSKEEEAAFITSWLG
ncbi:MAG: guanylate kinase [Sulfurovum sp.]|nr:guanylate kinase [Sulfurovum sp.]MCB4744524.1 guanylate kinase [Sulfurovum sp.]MCB4746141.1 guanylate kinase [Sulfurovum sp.]MCB4748881.1 guanylate kinase [Sulfurovum sp.]MCB4750757.1 guanylate kinase [Sulfurovum sp.]